MSEVRGRYHAPATIIPHQWESLLEENRELWRIVAQLEAENVVLRELIEERNNR